MWVFSECSRLLLVADLILVVIGARIVLHVLCHFLVVLLLQLRGFLLEGLLRLSRHGPPLLSTCFGDSGHVSLTLLAHLSMNGLPVLAQPEPVRARWLLWLVRIRGPPLLALLLSLGFCLVPM